MQELNQEIQQHLIAKHKILLELDCNENSRDPMSEIQTLIGNNNLVNLLHHRHPEGPTTPATYQWGQDQLDIAIGKPAVTAIIHKVGIEPFNSTFQSNHRGIYHNLDLKSLLSTTIKEAQVKYQQQVTRKTPKAIKIYITHLHKYLQSHQCIQRAQDIKELSSTQTSTPSNPLAQQINKLDRDITWGILYAKKQCKQKAHDPYLPCIIQTNQKKAIGAYGWHNADYI